MITAAQIATIAQVAGVGVPLIIEGLKAARCVFEGCDVELEAADAPDLLAQAQAQRTELARIATGTDRAAMDRALRGDADELTRASRR